MALRADYQWNHNQVHVFMGTMGRSRDQRDETNGVLARNVEFSQLVIDYERKVRESSDSLHAAEELSRKLTMEEARVKEMRKQEEYLKQVKGV
ncbi:hypothetical protein IFM89_021798 [Coptis chinensis]|uniref:Uncharacterized protein n=1 Tax=Coptis chinensis TaxID=261450 RepID=A0A835IQG8_9MAGN|nr:hypothetical protein IFM89_021798 [Coptis chinensis]